VSHSRKSAAQRAKSLEWLRAFQGAKPQRERQDAPAAKGPEAQAPATPFKYPEREAFDAAYGDRPITPEAAYWDARGIMRWQLATHCAGSRLAFNRNHPNG
jgi:hypothetical protein